MAGIIRSGDLSTVDPCGAPPHAPKARTSKVTIDGGTPIRVGDEYELHACPDSSPHTSTATGGSSKVTIEGLPAHRTGDAISCGSFAGNGSTKVTIG